MQNNYQRASFINSSNNITGSAFSSYSNIVDYFHLKVENEQLMAENARLRNQVDQAFRIADTNHYYDKDSLFRFVEAKVISNSINNQKNYLLLNKGRKDGILPDMGVITSDGIAGTVVEVSDHFARVMSVLHIQHKINARIKKNLHLGSVEWNGKDYRYGVLNDVPVHVKLNPGDTIITSGNSLIFPEGISVGTVSRGDERQIQAQGNFQSASVTYSVDFNKLYHVYVIINLMKPELDQVNQTEEAE